MERRVRVLEFIERIYEAVVDPEAWYDFVAELSEHLGGAAVQISLRLPDTLPTPDVFYRHNLDERYHDAFVKHVLLGLPWGTTGDDTLTGRFGLGTEMGSDQALEESAFYQDFMEPQGLAPESPLCHVICAHESRPIAGIAIYRREGGRAFEPEDMELLDALVPHFSRAYAIHAQLTNTRHERTALTEVIDRLPMGVILVDAGGRAILKNRSVERILALQDGFRLERGRPCVDDPRENRALQTVIAEVAKARPEPGEPGGGALCVSRPSGRRSFALWVGSLLKSSPENRTDEAKAILFIADPEGGQISTTVALESLYQLTRAEAELVRLLAEGYSLDQVAQTRGVTMNTVRSQLKQVFCKTDTSRQGELVHLVLTGVAAIRTDG